MPAPLRSWSENVVGPDQRRWSVQVTVPYLDSLGHDGGAVEHRVSVLLHGRFLRRSAWSRRVQSEAEADALQAQLAAALQAGWVPGKRHEPSKEKFVPLHSRADR